jgi:hypothetical protein
MLNSPSSYERELELQQLEVPRGIDPAVIQARIDNTTRRWGTLRAHIGAFRVPWPCTQRQYETTRKLAIHRWLQVMDKRGYHLESKLHIKGPYPAFGYSGDKQTLPLLDQREFRMTAAFSLPGAKPVRMELAGLPLTSSEMS